MTIPIVFDFTSIGAELRRLEAVRAPAAAVLGAWWCDDCKLRVPLEQVTYNFRHDEALGGCGCTVHPFCDACDNGGWKTIAPIVGLSAIQCQRCGNPFKRPRPSL